MKLKERSAELSSSCSPVPSPDYDAPSPAGSGVLNIFKIVWHIFTTVDLTRYDEKKPGINFLRR